MPIEATPEGAEDEEQPIKAHETRLAQIEALLPPEDVDPDADPVEKEPEQISGEEEPPETNDEKTDEPVTHTLKVDGEEVQKTQDEIIEAGIRALQKETSADRRLEEATRLLNEAKQNTQPPPDAVVEDQLPLVDVDVIQKIQSGTEEEASQALGDVIEAAVKKSQPTPEQPDVKGIVHNELEYRDIQTRFEKDFSEIIKDPRLLDMAGKEVNAKLAAGEPDSWETYESVGQAINDWHGIKKEEEKAADPMKGRKERKENVTNIKSASGTKTLDPEEKPETTQDVINGMAKARHQLT